MLYAFSIAFFEPEKYTDEKKEMSFRQNEKSSFWKIAIPCQSDQKKKKKKTQNLTRQFIIDNDDTRIDWFIVIVSDFETNNSEKE